MLLKNRSIIFIRSNTLPFLDNRFSITVHDFVDDALKILKYYCIELKIHIQSMVLLNMIMIFKKKLNQIKKIKK